MGDGNESTTAERDILSKQTRKKSFFFEKTLTKKMKLHFTTFSEIIINKENGKTRKKLRNNEKRIMKKKQIKILLDQKNVKKTDQTTFSYYFLHQHNICTTFSEFPPPFPFLFFSDSVDDCGHSTKWFCLSSHVRGTFLFCVAVAKKH